MGIPLDHTEESMVDTAHIEANWHQRGFSCDLWVNPPVRCWEDYVHSIDELVMVVDGVVEFEVAGVISQPSPGEELFIPAGAIHSVRNLGTTRACWLYGYRR